jgi:hypothetical protein
LSAKPISFEILIDSLPDFWCITGKIACQLTTTEPPSGHGGWKYLALVKKTFLGEAKIPGLMVLGLSKENLHDSNSI